VLKIEETSLWISRGQKSSLSIKKAVIDFDQHELNEGVIDRDRQGEFSRENWRKCADFGFQGLPFLEQYGGADEDIVTCMLMMEGLGVCLNLPNSIAKH
jgi:alkylation response protein AidB-like acyl-CoA dehydrogenase